MTPTVSRKISSSVRPASWAALCSALLLSACATIGTQTPEESVKLRANARWQALVDAKFDTAYSYNTAGFRALVTPEAFRSRTGSAVKWVAAQVSKVECPDTTKCEAQIKIDYKPILGGKPGDVYSTYVSESWLLENGQWWIFQPINQ